MSLFRKKNQAPKSEAPAIQIEPTTQDRLEIELHKDATKEAKQKADEINNHVRDLLGNNGFTVKIFLAAGGQLHHKKEGGK